MFPPDIDPESGFRLPYPNRDELDDDAGALYDRFAAPNGDSYVSTACPNSSR